MAETLVKNEVCGACGADVRDGALFCYNCGSNVSDAAALFENNGAADKNEIALSPANIKENTDAAVIKDESNHARNNGKAVSEEKPKLKSAASMRRKPKTIQRKRVEITWEEPESAPNVWFILVAVLLTLFAVGLWFIASYLK
jgi:uncharacterized Zn finger protein (UPF0148 family)